MNKIKLILLSNLIFINFCYADFSEQGHHSEQNGISQVLTITDQGLVPNKIDLTTQGSSVFILNKSKKDFNLEIDFSNKKFHCASRQIEMTKDGIMKTKDAIKPNEFVSVCFPDQGKHKLRAGSFNAEINVL